MMSVIFPYLWSLPNTLTRNLENEFEDMLHAHLDMAFGTLIHETCNIPNFGPNNYRHVSIDYDDYLDVLFYIG